MDVVRQLPRFRIGYFVDEAQLRLCVAVKTVQKNGLIDPPSRFVSGRLCKQTLLARFQTREIRKGVCKHPTLDIFQNRRMVPGWPPYVAAFRSNVPKPSPQEAFFVRDMPGLFSAQGLPDFRNENTDIDRETAVSVPRYTPRTDLKGNNEGDAVRRFSAKTTVLKLELVHFEKGPQTLLNSVNGL